MFKSNLLKLIFLSSFVQSETFISDIQYFNEDRVVEINAVIKSIKENIPIQDSWTKKSEYQALLNSYKNTIQSTTRTYKIKIPIKVGCTYGHEGVCYNVENEVLEIRRIENFFRYKIYINKQFYSPKKFKGNTKVSIPRDFLKDNFSNLILNAYIRLDIKDLVFNNNEDQIEIIDLILSDKENNIVLSTNFSNLIDIDAEKLNLNSYKNNVSKMDNSIYVKGSTELKIVDVGDISEIVNKSKKLKKARALQSSTAKKMAKVYEALEKVDEKGEPAPDMGTVTSILTELRDNRQNLRSYDRSVMWNAWAYVYSYEEKYDQAIQAYKYLIVEPDVTLPLRNGALYTLAQLNMAQENYIDGIKLLLLWMDQVETQTAQSYYLLAQAYYAMEYFQSAMDSVNFAISMAIDEGIEPNKNWYTLLDASTESFEDGYKTSIEKPKTNFKTAESFFNGGEYIPLFKVVPIYPRRAQERGTMGYALVEFTITETGSVEDANTIEGYCSNSNPSDPSTEFRPCTMFNSASARAALQLKYKPKIVDGKAVPVSGVLHRFTYILSEQ